MRRPSPVLSSSSSSSSSSIGRHHRYGFFRCCQPHLLDPRSVASLRVLLSLYLLYDVFVSRLGCGLVTGVSDVRFWLAWYTSDPPPSSILDPDDTPHHAALHRLWFHRGSLGLQVLLFGLQVTFAVLFGAGYRCRPFGIVPVLLWLNVVAMQCRSQSQCDGADTYLRSILFWCLQLDTGLIWSVDAYHRQQEQRAQTHHGIEGSITVANNQRSSSSTTQQQPQQQRLTPSSLRRRNKTFTQQQTTITTSSSSMSADESYHNTANSPMHADNSHNYHDTANMVTAPMLHKGPAALGLSLQIALMYLGTVYCRLPGTMWLYPDFTAVYYALSNTFSTKEFAADLVQAVPTLAKGMTLSAMVIETAAPLWCLLCPYDNKIRLYPALLLFSLHFGLYVMMRLPNWQCLGMLVCVTWIPSGVWDEYHGPLQLFMPQEDADVKTQKRRNGTSTSAIRSYVTTAVSTFFLCYMLYNWVGERGWVSKMDNGDLGEALRISQHWTMFSPDVGRDCTTVVWTGTTTTTANNNDDRVDLLYALKHNVWDDAARMSEETYRHRRTENAPNMSSRYPSMRFERAITSWLKEPHLEARIRRLSRFVCWYGSNKMAGDNIQLETIELAVRGMRTTRPDEEGRFVHTPHADRVYQVQCD